MIPGKLVSPAMRHEKVKASPSFDHTPHEPNELESRSQIACLVCTKFSNLIHLIIIIIDSTSSCSMFDSINRYSSCIRKLKAKCYRND